MRRFVLPILLAMSTLGGPAFADVDGPDLRETLRRDWHRCVRHSFSGQPVALEKKAAARAALSACKSAEDAYVAAELAAKQAEDETRRKTGRRFTARARDWVSSVAAYVVEPVTSWIGGIVR